MGHKRGRPSDEKKKQQQQQRGQPSKTKVKAEPKPPKKKVKETCGNKKKVGVRGDDWVGASKEHRQLALDKAEQVQSKLDQEYPSFVKTMRKSHVTGGFWLGLPHQFCVTYLPTEDADIALVDEELDASRTLFLAKKCGLSAGWRGFSIAHCLVDGDALVFHLVNSTTFKIYIIRVAEVSKKKNAKRKLLAVPRNKTIEKRSKEEEVKQQCTEKINISTEAQHMNEKKPVCSSRSNEQCHVNDTNHQEQGRSQPRRSIHQSQSCQSHDVNPSMSVESASSESKEWSAYEPSSTTLSASPSTTLSTSLDDAASEEDNCKGQELATSKLKQDAVHDDAKSSKFVKTASSESKECSAYSTTLPASPTLSTSLDDTATDSSKDANCKGHGIASSKLKQNDVENRDLGAGTATGCTQCFRLKCELRRKVEEAESTLGENIELRYFRTCKVCMEVDISVLLMPCKHLCLCKNCEPQLHVCPICNTAKGFGDCKLKRQ